MDFQEFRVTTDSLRKKNYNEMYFGNIVILKKFLAIIEIKFCKSLNLLELPRTLAINGPDLTGHIPLQL